MQQSDIAKIRLQSQHIAEARCRTAQELVGFMGAMQAQDYAMSKWAVGKRLSNTNEKAVEAALNTSQIIRTHLLRPTWHLVSSKDLYWMLELTAPHVKRILANSDKNLGLSDTIHNKAQRIIEKTLLDQGHSTREALLLEFQKAKITTEGNIPSHLMMRAELDGLVCSGKVIDKKQTYALLEACIKKPQPISREEGLAKLAERYFNSHGPATLQDFVWWSGLSTSDAKRALELVKSRFRAETVENETYWFNEAFISYTKKDTVHLLPAYDEYIISYKNRRATLTLEDQKKAFSSNGIFRPVIVVNGEGVGLWKRSIKKDTVSIETELFKTQSKVIKELIVEQAHKYATFLNKTIKLN